MSNDMSVFSSSGPITAEYCDRLTNHSSPEGVVRGEDGAVILTVGQREDGQRRHRPAAVGTKLATYGTSLSVRT